MALVKKLVGFNFLGVGDEAEPLVLKEVGAAYTVAEVDSETGDERARWDSAMKVDVNDFATRPTGNVFSDVLDAVKAAEGIT